MHLYPRRRNVAVQVSGGGIKNGHIRYPSYGETQKTPPKLLKFWKCYRTTMENYVPCYLQDLVAACRLAEDLDCGGVQLSWQMMSEKYNFKPTLLQQLAGGNSLPNY